MKSLFAFWPYDSFPYVLGAKVEDVNDEIIILKGYGRFGYSSNMQLVPYKTGAKLKDALDTLREQHREAFERLAADFKKRRDDLFKEHDVKLPRRG
jgi:hypothetical protein